MAGERVEVGEGTPWEAEVGYSRVVRVGGCGFVSGTIGVDGDGRIRAAGDSYAQATRALARIRDALEKVGMSMRDVVRTRIFVTDMRAWQEVARAHREAFPEHRPASTLVEVARLVLEEALVEIEADALVENPVKDGS